MRTVTKTHAEKRRAILIDHAVALAIPLLQIPLQYIDIGYFGETYEIPVAIVVFHLPPILIGAVSAVYCVRIKSFYHSRAQFRELLSASAHANLNLNRYIPLMALASTDLVLTVPLAAFVLYHRPQSPSLRGERRDAEVGDGGVCPAVLCVFWVCRRSFKKTTMSRSPSVWDIRRRGRRRGSVRLGVFVSSLLYVLLSFTNPPIPLRNIQIPPLLLPWLLARRLRNPPRLHPKRHHAETRLVRLLSDMSASYGGVSPLEYEDKEKALMLGGGDAHALTLGDSVHSAGVFLHRASVGVHVPTTLTPPEPVHVRRSSAVDGPMPDMDAADIVYLSFPFHLPATFPDTHTDPDPTRTPSYASENSLIYRYTTMTLPTYQLYL
ncbi:pheromone A receptor-domain-containing protein [Mycena leptocephala]|nr:pheromone A receptor-domain-containing protein [Mycena leptocephala]